MWNIFYYFFGNYLRSDTDKKVDLGNNERRNGRNTSVLVIVRILQIKIIFKNFHNLTSFYC